MTTLNNVRGWLAAVLLGSFAVAANALDTVEESIESEAGGVRYLAGVPEVSAVGEVTHSEKLLQGQLGRIRDARQGADGYIYLLNDTSDAGLFRLEPVN